MQLTTHSTEDTATLGRRLGAACRGGEVILLEGDLGAGKTTLAQGLAVGLGVVSPVTSPTFIMLREYDGRLPLYHFDFYRLEGTGRAVDLEFGDYLVAGGVCVIEWPSYAPEIIPPAYLRVALRVTGEETREVTLEAVGARYEALLSATQAETTAPVSSGAQGSGR